MTTAKRATGPAQESKMGRPRRFEPDVERAMLLDATVRAMTRNGFPATSVKDVLAEAGLSTRSFYRHFESKEQLVAAVVRREAERVHAGLLEATAAAADPVQAVEVWLDRTLDLFFDRGRSKRTALFATPAVVRSSRIPEELSELRELVFGPLADVLRDGHRAGVLSSSNPELDAVTMFELVSISAQSPVARRLGRSAVREHVVRFAWPALGLS